MEDYKLQMKELIAQRFSPISTEGEVVYKSTLDILEMCQGVIPTEPIGEHDVFEVMKEMGFEIGLVEEEKFLWILHKKV